MLDSLLHSNYFMYRFSLNLLSKNIFNIFHKDKTIPRPCSIIKDYSTLSFQLTSNSIIVSPFLGAS